jgi:hypothetical protein
VTRRRGRAEPGAYDEAVPGVWYAGYGSNLCPDRFACYLMGGTPAGAARCYPGTRERLPAQAVRPVLLPGSVFFAGESAVWGGGLAFYDPEPPGPAPARAALITVRQLADLVAQEMHRPPGTPLDAAVADAVASLEGASDGTRVALGPGRYETLVRAGCLGGCAVLTLTTPAAAALPPTAPSLPYLRTIAGGLRATHGWDDADIAAHLATRRGAAGRWTPRSLGLALASPE